MKSIHFHYDQLTENEKDTVDRVSQFIFEEARRRGIPLLGDDRCERAMDALAEWVIESRLPQMTPAVAQMARDLLKEAGDDPVAFEQALIKRGRAIRKDGEP